jgi:hypothetical protein
LHRLIPPFRLKATFASLLLYRGIRREFLH